jgi:hypothetical protein
MSIVCGGHSYQLHLPTSQHNILFGTTYADRGWTFQEILVSKRLLFVTEHQLAFYCGTAVRSEPLPEERRHHGSNFASGIIDLRLKTSLARSNCEILQSYITLVKRVLHQDSELPVGHRESVRRTCIYPGAVLWRIPCGSWTADDLLCVLAAMDLLC